MIYQKSNFSVNDVVDDCVTGAHGLQCSQVENSVVAGGGASGSANGVGALASFNTPSFLEVSSDGSYALITDSLNHKIRKIVMSTSAVNTFAGSGSSSEWSGNSCYIQSASGCSDVI
jgi:hypothetical protein